MSEVMEAPAKPRDVSALMTNIGLSEQLRQDWVLLVPEGHAPDDLLDTGYWAHVAQRFQQFDRIEARAETGEWLAELLVVRCGRNWASVKMLALHELNEATKVAGVAAKHFVKWRGAVHKWCVLRISDQQVIQTGLDSRLAAESALEQYERVLNT